MNYERRLEGYKALNSTQWAALGRRKVREGNCWRMSQCSVHAVNVCVICCAICAVCTHHGCSVMQSDEVCMRHPLLAAGAG
eukprot:scaffold152472_cov21-Tisochrysis_lutea.AAC.2